MVINKSNIDNFIKRRASQAEELGGMYMDIQEIANNFPYSALLDVCDTVQYLQAAGVSEILQELPKHIEVTSQRGLIIFHHQSEGREITLYIDANIRAIYFDFLVALTQRRESKIDIYIRQMFKSKPTPPRIYYNFLRSAQERGLTEAAMLELLTTATYDVHSLIGHISEVANALR